MAYGNFGGFGGANINQLMRQAQKMQEEMAKAKKELEESEFSSSVGGGMVEAKMMGDRTLKSILLNLKLLISDMKLLEDLIVSAVNDCLGQINRKEKESLPNVPGMM